MTIASQPEIERKYDVDEASILPTLAGADGVAAMGQAVEHDLEAVYHDTAGLDLARRRVTLRRRTGGSDAGWHLKLPAADDERIEVHVPLGPPGEPVPEELRALVLGVVRDRELRPVARIRNRRLEHALMDGDGTVIGQLCDDHVTAQRLSPEREPVAWREWEVEVAPGTADLLDSLEPVLLAAGATPAAAGSKLQRTVGAPEATPATPGAAEPASAETAGAETAAAPAAEVLRHQLEGYLDRLLAVDRAVRSDAADSVHQLRTTARRLRSALATYGPLLVGAGADDAARAVRAELRWLGRALAPARDAEVLRARLDAALAAEPPELVWGAVRAHIDDELAAEARQGRQEALEALATERYFRLLDALEELVGAAVSGPGSEQAAREALPGLLARDAKRLRRAVDAVSGAEGPTGRDAALHEARKKAKRLRYAAESAEPVLGRRARRLGKRAKRVQDALGEHHDAVVARERLRRYAAQTQGTAESAFTLGRLHALEQQRAADAEEAFHKAYRKLPQKAVRDWLDGA